MKKIVITSLLAISALGKGAYAGQVILETGGMAFWGSISTYSSEDKNIKTAGWVLIALSLVAGSNSTRADDKPYDYNSSVNFKFTDGTYSANVAQALESTEMEALYMINHNGAVPSVGLEELAKALGTSPKDVARLVSNAKALADKTLKGEIFSPIKTYIISSAVNAITTNPNEQVAVANYLALRNISVN